MKEKAIIILGTAHFGTTPGKCSPDKRLREAVYSREIVSELCAKLRTYGYRVEVDYEPLQPSAAMKASTAKMQQQYELAARKNFVNKLCAENGAKNCLYVSVHVNAAGADGKWHTAGGFCAFTSRGRTQGDLLASCIYEAADNNLGGYKEMFYKAKASGYYDRKQVPIRTDYADGDPDLESDFYVLAKTKCPATLVECMFQDNKCDVAWLLSDAGRHALTRTLLEGIIKYIDKL